MEWTAERKAELLDRWDRGERPSKIRRAMNLTPGQMAGRITKWNLHSPTERRRSHNPDHPSVAAGRTRYPGMVTDEGRAIKPGTYQQKLGGRVTKGKWKGMPIYAITLEERATCPRDCKLFADCYGNSLHWAKRMRHGDGLEAKIWPELADLQRRHPRGFVIRLHILGEFYAVSYLELWREALSAFPALHVFGYTARQDRIGRAVAALRDSQWDRFAVRTSGAAEGPRTFVVDDASEAKGAIICPAQTGRTQSCATCSLCWASKKDVAFLRH